MIKNDNTETQNSEESGMEQLTIPYLHPKVALKDLKPNGKLFTDEQIQLLLQETQTHKRTGQSHRFRPGRYSKKFVRDYLASKQLLDTPYDYVNGLLITKDKQLYAIYKGEKFNRALGRGHFGKAKLVQNLQTGEWVVLKILNPHIKKGTISKEAVDHMMQKAQHEVDNIKVLYPDLNTSVLTHTSSGLKKAQFILPLAKGNTISFFANNASLPTLNWLKLTLAMLESVARLHDSGLYHCDLKPQNMIYDPVTNTVHAIDLGLSISRDTPTIKSWRGTAFYSAPEIHPAFWHGDVTFNEQTEVFALGISIAEMLGIKIRLFTEGKGLLSSKTYKQNIDNKKVRQELLVLLQEMVAIYPEKRPTLKEAIDRIHSIINQYYHDDANTLQPITRIAYVDCATLASLRKLKSKNDEARQQFHELIMALKRVDVVQLLSDDVEPLDAMKVRYSLMNRNIKVKDQVLRWDISSSDSNESRLIRLNNHTQFLEKEMNCALNAFYVRTPTRDESDSFTIQQVPKVKEIIADPNLKKKPTYYQKQMCLSFDLVPVSDQHLDKINAFISKRLGKLAENDPHRRSLQEFRDQLKSEDQHPINYGNLELNLNTLKENVKHAGNRFGIFIEKKIGAVRPNTKAIEKLAKEIEHDLRIYRRH